MYTLWLLVNLLAFTQFVACRDFYFGMFRRNDFLVAQDVIYKAPSPFGYTTASYGRLFKCPITYFRVVDRLGVGRGPFTTIVRGGLKKKFISVRIKSTYRLPVSVNIYVGCENRQPSTQRSVVHVKLTTDKSGKENTKKNNNTDSGNKSGKVTDKSEVTNESDVTTASKVNNPTDVPTASQVTNPTDATTASEVNNPTDVPTASEVNNPTDANTAPEVNNPTDVPAASEVNDPTDVPTKTEATAVAK